MTSGARMRIGVIAALMLGALAAPARAGLESAGTRAASFLAQGATPAVMGMGGAALGLSHDLTGAGLNVAALGWIGEQQLAVSHAQLADQTSLDGAALAGRLRGGALRYGLAAQYRNDGDIVGRDANNRPTEDVVGQSLAMSVQLARPFGPHLTLGGAAKYIGEHVGQVHGNGLAFDAGVQLQFGMLGFGLAGQNFGGGMIWDGVRWRMPASLGAGIALDHAASGLRLALDVNVPSTYARDVRVGSEWRLRDRLALRGGWRHLLGAGSDERLNGPAFGLGLKAGSIWMDYAFQVGEAGTSTHRVSLNLRPGRALQALTPSAVARPAHRAESATPQDAHHLD